MIRIGPGHKSYAEILDLLSDDIFGGSEALGRTYLQINWKNSLVVSEPPRKLG
jgi:hypothetical protein